jgi:hypothetical protein
MESNGNSNNVENYFLSFMDAGRKERRIVEKSCEACSGFLKINISIPFTPFFHLYP